MTVASHAVKHKRESLSIRKAARLLETDFSHLARVLKGERVSKRLFKRYRELKRSMKGAAK